MSAGYQKIKVDSVTSLNFGTGASRNVSVTVGSGSNRALVIAVPTRSNSVVSVSFNGKSGVNLFSTGSYDNCEVDFLIIYNPDLGTHTLNVTLAGTNATVIGVASLNGVHQSSALFDTGEDGQNGGTTNVGLNTPTNIDGCFVLDAQFNTYNGIASPSSGQTVIVNSAGTDTGGVSYKANVLAGAISMGWSPVGSNSIMHGAVLLQPAPISGASLLMSLL